MRDVNRHLRQKAERKRTEDTGQKPLDPRFYYRLKDIEDFVDMWRLSDYKLTLTGSYVQDKELYPGWWDNDVPLFLSLYMPHEKRVEEIIRVAESDG